MRNVHRILADILVTRSNPTDDLVVSLHIRPHGQHRVVAQLAQVLQRLENVLLGWRDGSGLHVDICLGAFRHQRFDRFITSLGSLKVVVQALLDSSKIAIIVLDDLRWQIVQDVLFHSSQDKWQHLLVKRFQSEDSFEQGWRDSVLDIGQKPHNPLAELTGLFLLRGSLSVLVCEDRLGKSIAKLLFRPQESWH